MPSNHCRDSHRQSSCHNITTQISTATPPPPRCPQVQILQVIGTEDCLYLNIYPSPSSDPLSSLLLKPVLVFIHGGSFIIGSIDSPFLDGTSLALSQDIVVVTINYRLGALGFVTHPDIPTRGNLGLLDQQLALKWVQKYIHHFNGDPAQITLGGQSAGGYSACLHMVMEVSREMLQAVWPCPGKRRWTGHEGLRKQWGVMMTTIMSLPHFPPRRLGMLASSPTRCPYQGLSRLWTGNLS